MVRSCPIRSDPESPTPWYSRREGNLAIYPNRTLGNKTSKIKSIHAEPEQGTVYKNRLPFGQPRQENEDVTQQFPDVRAEVSSQRFGHFM